MKKYLINNAMDIISSNYPDYDQDKKDEIRYGLEATYLSITKVIVILLVTLILGIFKEAVTVLVFFNILRMFAFGIHAKESWQCWISSSILFIGIPYLCIYLNINDIYHYIVIGLSILIFILYAPADTVKRPLIKKNRRIKFKVLTLITSLIFIIIFFYTDSIFIKNVISSCMLLESVLIHPLTYRVFKLPYKNYERYELVN